MDNSLAIGLVIGLLMGMLVGTLMVLVQVNTQIDEFHRDNACMPKEQSHEFIGIYFWCRYELEGCYEGFKNWTDSFIDIYGDGEASRT